MILKLLNDLLTLALRFWFFLGEACDAFHSEDAKVYEEPMFSKWLHSTLQLHKRPELDQRQHIVHPRSQQTENLWKPGLSRGRIWCNHASCCLHGGSSLAQHSINATELQAKSPVHVSTCSVVVHASSLEIYLNANFQIMYTPSLYTGSSDCSLMVLI